MPDQIVHPEIRQSLTGRIRNFNLPPTAENCLMPVYEAIGNAFYAIQEKFPDDWTDKGVITVEVLREDIPPTQTEKPKKKNLGRVTGFVITDNGIGLSNQLFECFQELDTEYRRDKKGRGIGRLSWLKVFKSTDLISIYKDSGRLYQRSFRFQLSNTQPFDDYREDEISNSDTGTIVNLENYRDVYYNKAPIDPLEIRNKILAHFIAIFARPKRLKVNLVDDGNTVNLSDFFFGSIVGQPEKSEICLSEGVCANIQHLLIPKKLAPMENSIIYCAADRTVVQKNINEALGLKHLPSDEHGNLVYIGLCSGDLFDDALNHERTGFDFGDIDFEEVNKLFVDSTKLYLATFLKAKREKNRKLLEQLLENNPLYASGISDFNKYVEDMPLNWDETRLVQDVALQRHRSKKNLFAQIEKLEDNTKRMSDEQFQEHVKKITDDLSETEKGALAQYVVERKMVIELLKNRRKRDAQYGKHQSESSVHEIICPLGVTSDAMDYDDHNLWLIDDRLAYYSFIASDRPISSFSRDTSTVSDEEATRRTDLQQIGAYSTRGEPDLAIFSNPMIFRRVSTADPVAILEFKSPDKTTYTGDAKDNPVMQIRKYIESLINKTCYDHENNRITDLNKDTPFNCFLIAEPCEQLYSLLRSHGIHKPTPDGNGKFGYFEDINAYFEFIPYEQVIKNSSLRNEAFFRKLGIHIKGKQLEDHD